MKRNRIRPVWPRRRRWNAQWLVSVGLLLTAACTSVATVTPIPTATPPIPTPVVPTPQPTATPRSQPVGSFDILDAAGDDPRALMFVALETIFNGDSRAARRMGNSGDQSFIPVLVEFLPFFGFDDTFIRGDVIKALVKLAEGPDVERRAEHGDWGWWVEWIGKRPDVQPPDGFVEWKGTLLGGLVDPAMRGFLYDGATTTIRPEEIIWGGVRKDGIPDLRFPPTLPAEQATYMLESDRVFGVSFNGEHRAYPHRIINAHEMVNDRVGGVPFALAY